MKLDIADNITRLENKNLEEKIALQLGLKTDITWNIKRETGSIKFSVSSLDQFDTLLEKLGVHVR